jgi:hypothetical protein
MFEHTAKYFAFRILQPIGTLWEPLAAAVPIQNLTRILGDVHFIIERK